VTAPARIHIHIESRPSRARIVDLRTSEVWGTTPLDVERPAAATDLTLRVSKPRFESVVVTIGGDRDTNETVELRPLRGEASAPAPAAPVEPAPAETPPARGPPPIPDEPGKI
jgi:hypothetical protein